MTFKGITNKARSEWEALQRSSCIIIGTATCGRAAGALDVVDAFKKELTRQGIEVPIIQVGCMELCYADPLVTISKPGSLRVVYHNVTPEIVPRLVEGYIAGDDPCLELALGTLEGGGEGSVCIPELSRFEHELRLILGRCGYIDPENINHYIANGGYSGLEKALRMLPAEIIGELLDFVLTRSGNYAVRLEAHQNMSYVMLMKETPVLLWTGSFWKATHIKLLKV